MAEYIGDITVTVLCESTSSFEIDARHLIDILEGFIASAPAEVADTFKVEMEASTEWDSGVASLTLTRSETEAEADAREEKTREATAKRMAEYRTKQFAEYQRLKAIFDGAH